MFAYFVEMRGSEKVVIKPYRHEGNKFFLCITGEMFMENHVSSTKPSSKTLP